MRRITLYPGEWYVCREAELTLSTLLGSCVAACLYDPVKRVFGMNHFLLASNSGKPEDLSLTGRAGRFGLNAMELLINEMLRQGAERRYLQAKAFGGANVLHAGTHRRYAIGDLNCEFIRSFLQQEGIPLVAADLGGRQGRQIHFQGSDFAVYVRLLGDAHKKAITAHEQNFLERSLQQQRERDEQDNVTFL